MPGRTDGVKYEPIAPRLPQHHSVPAASSAHVKTVPTASAIHGPPLTTAGDRRSMPVPTPVAPVSPRPQHHARPRLSIAHVCSAKSETLRIKVANNEEHYIVEALNENGSRLHTEYRAKYDGKDYPNKNLITEATTFVSIQAVDANTELVTNKRDGKVTSSYRRVLSADGKTLTSMILAPDGSVRSVRVFDRQ